MPRITLLNGPNLNLLGEREPEIYGRTTLPEIEARCQALAEALGLTLRFEQSNSEAVLVDAIQEERVRSDALIINPAGLSFHSVPILDAIRIFRGPVIELHLSNIHARDAAHRHSIQSAAATGVICGLGPYGYQVAMLAALDLIGHKAAALPVWLRSAGR